MNHVCMIGNLTSDPELRTVGNDIHCATLRIAVPRHYVEKDGDRKTDFFNCVAWRRDAETIAKMLHKGDKICFQGEVRTNEYTDKNNNRRVDYQITINEWEFCSRRKTEEPKAEPAQEFIQVDDDSLPF